MRRKGEGTHGACKPHLLADESSRALRPPLTALVSSCAAGGRNRYGACFPERNRTGGSARGVRVPRHIAIIMDGNGRWAQKRGAAPHGGTQAAGCGDLPPHRYLLQGNRASSISRSTPSRRRTGSAPKDEVAAIMGLLKTYLLRGHPTTWSGIRCACCFFGDISRLSSPELRGSGRRRRTRSRTHYDGFQANICLNYGGRDEIVRAARAFAADCAAGERKPEDLTEEASSVPISTPPAFPTPTWSSVPAGRSGSRNFLLWQSRVCGILLYGRAVAGLRRGGAGRRYRVLSTAGTGGLEA